MTDFLPKLNIPLQTVETRRLGGKTFIKDFLRKKWLVAKPEEWVRQQLLAHLINDLGYPKQKISIEKQLTINRIFQRYDAALLNEFGDIELIIECKSPNVSINQQTLDQTLVYFHYTQARGFLITNGIAHLMVLKNNDGFLHFNEILPYSTFISTIK